MADARMNLEILTVATVAHEAVLERPLEEEVTALFEQLRPALLKYLCTFRLTFHDGEEIVQDVFLCLFSHLRKERSRTNLRGWIFRVAHNLALKQRYSRDKIVGLAERIGNLPHPALNPEEELVSNQRQERLSSVFDVLPEQDRRCLYLRAEGLRYREIAEILGVSLGFVAASLERSLTRLKRADRKC